MPLNYKHLVMQMNSAFIAAWWDSPIPYPSHIMDVKDDLYLYLMY